MTVHFGGFQPGRPAWDWQIACSRSLVRSTGMSWLQAVMICFGEEERAICDYLARALARRAGNDKADKTP